MCPTAPQGHFPGVETKGAFTYTGARFTNEGLSDFDSPSQLSAPGLRVGGWRRVPMQTKEQGSSVWGPEPSLGALPGRSSPCPAPQSSLPPLIPPPWLCTPLSKQPARYASAGNAAQQGALLQAKNCSPPGAPRTASQPPGSVSTGRVQTRVCGVGPGHCTVSKDPE